MFLRLFIIAVTLFSSIIISCGNVVMTKSPSEYWDDMGPYSLTFPSSDLKLPTTIAPSFYRLKIKPDLINSNFSGEVYITLRPNKRTKEIILHSKNLNINNNVRLTEQIYEKVETVYRTKRKRDVPVEATVTLGNTTSIASNISADSAETNITTETTTNISEFTTEAPTLPVDTQITHSSINEIKILGISEGTGDRLIIVLETSLKAGVDYVLELSFKGNISNALTGFYKSTYTNSKNEVKTLAVTQFEPTSARTAFPCFDEPAFKAKFEISIAHPENITVLSNMELASEETILEQPNWKWAHFERSVEMSTYLVAYILSDFKSLETNYTGKDNVTKPVRVWTRPELITQANYALTITPKLIRLYEDVFGVPYALKKLDLIAIPDFSSGAMENWGLVTFRETTLLFDEKESSPREKQNVAVDIAHELAHQWFGNLVTMKWWTDLWLNEGFATYIEYLAVDHLEPGWKMFESFSLDKMNLLRLDALKHTSPVSKKVVDNSEITQKFDDISYMKAANLIRMLNHTVSKELFHKGLAIYLNNWKYSNAEENDLWEAMSTAIQSNPALAGQSVVEFMNSWTRQAGYPVVNINRNYETGVVEMEQRLYTSTKEPYQHMIDQLWHIPISYTAMDAPLEQWSTAPKTWLKDRIGVFKPNITKDQALYVNVDAIGYYRVNYDQRNWELLGEALRSGHFKSPLMKAQLLDDAFNLAKTSQLNYNYALGLSTYVKNGEDSRVVWDLLLNNMAFLKYNLRSTSGYVYFQDFLKSILSKQLELINYGLDKPKDDNEAFLIENLVMWECYVESPRCLDWARTQFDSWTKQTNLTNNPIPSYLRPIVYNMALRHGGRREFEFLWDAFMNSTDPYVKSIIITNLPYTRDESLITMLLEKSLTEIPKQYAVAVWTVEPPTGTRIAQNFLINNFDKVYSNFTEIDPFIFSEVLNGAFGFISTNEELNRLKSFALEHKEKLLPVSQTLQRIVDIAQLRIEWITKYAKGINLWLKNYVTGKTQENGVEIRTSVPVPYLNSTDSGIATTDKPTNIDNTTSQTN